jgi:AAA+ ATPase superfamily predicted ATPase
MNQFLIFVEKLIMNPFGITYTPEYFCDRKKETQQLESNIKNGLNTLLHSPRRLGKTALICHLFHRFEKMKQYDTIYIDLFSTRDMTGLITLLAEKILHKYHSRNFFEGVKTMLKGISPVVTFSPDGSPTLSLNLQQSQQKQTLDDIFRFLETRKKQVVIAFDEFQEVATYPEKAEATLRSFIQFMKNVKFIFSGSSNHILQEMFYSSKRPFYQSSEVLVLDKIDEEIYSRFIMETFQKNNKKIEQDAVHAILEFSETYTYYTQICCNQCFSKTEKELTANETKRILKEYLESRKADYLQLFSLLPENQKKVAAAVAKKGEVTQPTAFEFIMKYKLPVGSSTLQAIKSLTEKEILYYNQGKYTIYDVFFKQFLSSYY